ncbi:hypothetical protein GF376_02160 [Candidatus Peregrinibacteria bacterium]|nr:hypothetical protein [Candidatus Peregrinibacteria bacterium]
MATKTKTKKHTNSKKKNIKDNKKTKPAKKKIEIKKYEVKSGKSEEFGSKYLSLLLDGKKAAKQEVGCDTKKPLVLVFATNLNGEKDLLDREILFALLEGLRILDMKAVVISTQQMGDINNLSELPTFSNNHIIWYNPKTDNSGRGREEKEIDRLLLAADMAVIFDQHLELIHLLMNYGVVIVGGHKSPLLEEYKPNEETGNSFLYKKKSHWEIFATVVRALETFRFPYDWKNIIKKIYK